ncbi:MAG TPA: ATP-binding protein [Terracidiphilus sp.]|jgi:hypothetical protein
MREAANAFPDVPRDARGHLGLLFYAAAFHLIYHLRCGADATNRTLEQVLEEYPFLSSYFSQVRSRLPEEIDWGRSLHWLRMQILEWEQEAPGKLPLVEQRTTLGIGFAGTLAFVLAGMVEERAEFGDIFASLQQSQGQRRPSLALLQRILEDEECAEAWLLVRPLIDGGYILVVNRDAPRAEWILRVPTVLWNAVRGERAETPFDQARHHPAHSLERLTEMLIDARLRDQLSELTVLARAGRISTIIIRGMPGTDRLGAIGAIAGALDKGLLEIEGSSASPAAPQAVPTSKEERWRLIGPLCTLTSALPAILVEAGPGESFEVPSLGGYRGPIAVMIGREGGVVMSDAEPAVTIHLDLESPADRLEIWRRAIEKQSSEKQLSNGHSASDLSRIASAFCLPGLYIRQCARLAGDYAAMERRYTIRPDDVRWAARAMNRQVLDTLATRVDGDAGWPQLIVKSATSRELQSLEQRCRHRERLASAFHGSIPGGMNRGVRALFEGPSGTGKTLAARVLATELGLDLYRVDLAAVVNKYIGETEKNLSRVLSRAEDLNVILLLDEGDSLMTRRTDVKSANDRNANLETDYLLQRLEHYTGIVVITTNAGQTIDSAFRRRMDSVVKFQLPDASERLRLWAVHLPVDHGVESDALEEIAWRYELTGGQIRNVCVNAALAALSGGGFRVCLAHLKASIQAEHRKSGSTFIDSITTPMARNRGSIAAFLGGLT